MKWSAFRRCDSEMHFHERRFWSKVNIWNVNSARATAFIYDTRTDVLVKVSRFLDRKCRHCVSWYPAIRKHMKKQTGISCPKSQRCAHKPPAFFGEFWEFISGPDVCKEFDSVNMCTTRFWEHSGKLPTWWRGNYDFHFALCWIHVVLNPCSLWSTLTEWNKLKGP